MRYCTKCGAPNPEQSRFCRNCGEKLQDAGHKKFMTWRTVGVLFWILGLLFISFVASNMQPWSTRQWEFNSGNALLSILCIVFLFVVYPLLQRLKKLCHVQSRNFSFALLSTLLTILVVVCHSWSKTSYVVYSILIIGLAVNSLVAWFLRPAKGGGRFLKVYWFAIAAICAVLSLVSIYAIINPKEYWEEQNGIVESGKDFHYSHRDIYDFMASDAIETTDSVGFNSFDELPYFRNESNVFLLFHNTDYHWGSYDLNQYVGEIEFSLHLCNYRYCLFDRVFSLYGNGREELFVYEVISSSAELANEIGVDGSEKIQSIEKRVNSEYMMDAVIGTLFFMILTALFFFVGKRQKDEK